MSRGQPLISSFHLPTPPQLSALVRAAVEDNTAARTRAAVEDNTLTIEPVASQTLPAVKVAAVDCGHTK